MSQAIPTNVTAAIAQLGQARDDYERECLAMCENDPENAKLAKLMVKHLIARRACTQH